MKKVLVVYFSQSGQLFNILQSLMSSLENSNQVAVTYETLKPIPAYPFPWSPLEFFDVFPESVLEIPTQLEPFQFDPEENFDLVVLGYQTWFLSPSIPITSFLSSSVAGKCLKDKPVITVIGCRNMWLMGQEQIKKRLKEFSAQLVMNIPFVDRSPNLVSVVTIPAWMFTGKQDYFKLLPSAGVSQRDIEGASRFGNVILDYLQRNPTENKPRLCENYPAEVNPKLMGNERTGRRVFKIWARLIKSVGNSGSSARKLILRFFMVYLVVVMIVAFPFNYLIYLLQRILNKKGLQKKVEYYSKN
jgi:hypothetical protein